MRAALLIVLGLAIGVIGTVFSMRALSERNPLPAAVMVTMGLHRHQLQQTITARQCPAQANAGQLEHMQMIAADIPTAFPGAPQPFQDLAGHLRHALAIAASSAPADCTSLATALKPVDQACQDCQRQYR